jgi:hypothetical protein
MVHHSTLEFTTNAKITKLSANKEKMRVPFFERAQITKLSANKNSFASRTCIVGKLTPTSQELSGNDNVKIPRDICISKLLSKLDNASGTKAKETEMITSIASELAMMSAASSHQQSHQLQQEQKDAILQPDKIHAITHLLIHRCCQLRRHQW